MFITLDDGSHTVVENNMLIYDWLAHYECYTNKEGYVVCKVRGSCFEFWLHEAIKDRRWAQCV